MHKLDIARCRPAASAFAAALVAGALAAGCGKTGNPIGALIDPGTAAPSGTPTKRQIRPTEYVCDSDRIAELGLGLRRVQTKADAERLLRGVMPFPDPATLPEGLTFQEGYINSAMLGRFKQSTLSLVWVRGDGDFAIHYMNAYPPIEEPPREPHEQVRIRDDKLAYLFEPPFREGLHSIMWREGCRYISVIGLATKEEVLKVAEGLMLPEETPPDATLGDTPEFLAPDKALPTVIFPTDSTPVPGMTGTPVFGPNQPGVIPEGASAEAEATATE